MASLNRMRVTTATVLLVAAAVAVGAALTGCAQAVDAASESSARDSARQRVEEVLRDVAHDRYDDIDFAARAVDAAIETTPVRLIGIDHVDADALGERFGTLSFLLPEDEFVDNAGVAHRAGPFCFRVGFTYYGAETDGDVVATDEFDCPADAAEVTPPPDATVYPVVPENARDAVHQVLAQVAAEGGSPSTDDIAARIVALLTPPSSELQTLAQPDVVERDGRIGVALQDAAGCLLVKLADDTVSDVYPPAVLLQPGELGCSAATAIADDDQLRSPH